MRYKVGDELRIATRGDKPMSEVVRIATVKSISRDARIVLQFQDGQMFVCNEFELAMIVTYTEANHPLVSE